MRLAVDFLSVRTSCLIQQRNAVGIGVIVAFVDVVAVVGNIIVVVLVDMFWLVVIVE